MFVFDLIYYFCYQCIFVARQQFRGFRLQRRLAFRFFKTKRFDFFHWLTPHQIEGLDIRSAAAVVNQSKRRVLITCTETRIGLILRLSPELVLVAPLRVLHQGPLHWIVHDLLSRCVQIARLVMINEHRLLKRTLSTSGWNRLFRRIILHLSYLRYIYYNLIKSIKIRRPSNSSQLRLQ